MTDLLHVIPDFPTKGYTHLIPSLERNYITVVDLVTLDAVELAKRAQLPLLNLRLLKEHVQATLQRQLGLKTDLTAKFDQQLKSTPSPGSLRTSGHDLIKRRGVVRTLDDELDVALGGGIQVGYVTEITGERSAWPSTSV